MLKNYLKTAYRNIKKTRLYSFINVLGLAIGMTACLLILHYVYFEKSFDRFHDKSERIYRLRYERTDEQGQSVRFASCCPPAADRIRGSYPEVEKIGRLFRFRAVVSHEDIKFLEERMYFAEADVFEILKFKFLSGDPLKGLKKPNNAFISMATAKKYFAGLDPVGKTFSVDKKTDYQVVGVFQDIPPNSHLKFDILLPWENLVSQFGPEYTEAWGHTGSYTYILAKPGIDPQAFERKLQDLVKAQCPWLKEYKMTMGLIMQPLNDIHLTSHYMQEYEVNGSLDTINFLYIIAFFIMIMAWVNYINLSTARSLTRAREVGLRKVVGASRKQLMIQFFIETMIINLIAILLALGFVKLSLPFFSRITGTPMEFSIWSQGWLGPALIIMLIVGVFLSGLYPVLALTSFKPVKVLKGKLGHSARGINLRKMLVVFQFAMALALMIATITVFKQISFMRNRDLGFDIDHIMVVKAPRVRQGGSYKEKFQTLKDNLTKQSGISHFSSVSEVPGRQIYWDNGAIRRAGEDKSKGKNYQIVGIDYDFARLFNLKFVAGRNFSKEFPSDEDALIFNETAVKWMGFDSPEEAINQQVDYWGKIYTIVGVLKDYHQQSPKEAFEPHIFRLMPYGRGIRGVFALKVNARGIGETVDFVRKQYESFFPGNPFDYFFLDDYFNQQYKSDEILGRVFTLFSSLAILITAMGILGLSAYSAAQRNKEIAVRKVLGASITGILHLIMKDFMVLLSIAFLLILPFMFFGLNHWLESFAFRTGLNVIVFIIPFLFVAAVTGVTVTSMTIKTASANPAETLKYE